MSASESTLSNQSYRMRYCQQFHHATTRTGVRSLESLRAKLGPLVGLLNPHVLCTNHVEGFFGYLRQYSNTFDSYKFLVSFEFSRYELVKSLHTMPYHNRLSRNPRLIKVAVYSDDRIKAEKCRKWRDSLPCLLIFTTLSVVTFSAVLTKFFERDNSKQQGGHGDLPKSALAKKIGFDSGDRLLRVQVIKKCPNRFVQKLFFHDFLPTFSFSGRKVKIASVIWIRRPTAI